MTESNFGDLMTALYREFLLVYQDEDLAAVATAAAIEGILEDQKWARTHEPVCAA